MFEDALRTDARGLLADFNSELEKNGFYLAGGSGLALQLGHRVSEDLDFFTVRSFQPELVSRYLEARPEYRAVLLSSGTLYCTIRDIKLSFIRQEIPLLFPMIPYGAIKVADWRDIIADKFETLAARGSRRDFYDLYAGFSIGNLSIAEAVGLLRQRFGPAKPNDYHILKSLTYFVDAEAEPESALLKPLSWSKVKDFFILNIRDFERELLR